MPVTSTRAPMMFHQFIDHYPRSPYIAYAHLFLGNINYRQAHENPAVQSYINGIFAIQRFPELDGPYY